jgi:hypothetical protein
LTSALGGGEWSASRPGHFTPRERAPGTHIIIITVVIIVVVVVVVVIIIIIIIIIISVIYSLKINFPRILSLQFRLQKFRNYVTGV